MTGQGSIDYNININAAGTSGTVKGLIDEKAIAKSIDALAKMGKQTASITQRSYYNPMTGGQTEQTKFSLGKEKKTEGLLGSILKGTMGILAGIGIVAAIWSGLDVFLRPILTIFKAIMMLLFIPLIPIFKLFVVFMTAMAKGLIKILPLATKILNDMFGSKGEQITAMVENIFNSGYVKVIIDAIVGIGVIFGKFVEALPVLLVGVLAILTWFAQGGVILFQIILDALLWVGKFLVSSWDVIKSALDWVAEFLDTSWTTIKEILDWVSLNLDSVWKDIKVILDWAKDNIKTVWADIQKVLEGAKDLFKSGWDGVIGVLTLVKDTLNGIASALSTLTFGAWGGSSKKGFSVVRDAVIKPNGQVIQTDPSDYIFATKNPKSLGGEGGGNYTVNISIDQPTFRNQNDVRDMVNLIENRLKSEMRRRVSYV